MEFIALTKNNRRKWNNFLAKHPSATIFHTLEWKNLLEKTYQFSPNYYLLEENGVTIGILPLFKVKNLRSNKLVSLPVSMYGGPLLKNSEDLKKILQYLKDNYKEFSINTKIELDDNLLPTTIHRVKINQDFYIEEKQKPQFEINTKKRQIKFFLEKNEQLGTEFHYSTRPEILKKFFPLFVYTRKRQHLFVPSKKHLEKMFHLKTKPIVFYCTNNNKVTSTLFCLKHQNELYNVYNCTSKEGREISSSDYLFFHCIQYCFKHNLRFYFGGAPNTPNNEGLINYKKKWGSIKETEYTYTNNQHNLRVQKVKSNGFKLVKILPNFIYKKIGHHIIKHFY